MYLRLSGEVVDSLCAVVGGVVTASAVVVIIPVAGGGTGIGILWMMVRLPTSTSLTIRFPSLCMLFRVCCRRGGGASYRCKRSKGGHSGAAGGFLLCFVEGGSGREEGKGEGGC